MWCAEQWGQLPGPGSGGLASPHQHRPNTVVDVMERYIILGEPIVRRSLATLALQWQQTMSHIRGLSVPQGRRNQVSVHLFLWISPSTGWDP